MRQADPTFQRARRPEQKEQRHEAILTAAREAALESGVRSVSLNDIAERVGIHKSALLRYFETREEIFLELTARSWQEWAASVSETLHNTEPARPALVAEVLAANFATRPLLCDLIPHTALTLERNVSVEAVRRYKYRSLGAVQAVSTSVSGALPELDAEACRELVSTLATLAGGFWQIANPPPALADLYDADPALDHARIDVEPRLRRTAEVMLAGLAVCRK
jgi:AcrR family transcriptional regulator